MKYIKWLLLFVSTPALAGPADSYLVFPNMSACLAHSKGKCDAHSKGKCDGAQTVYWYACQDFTDGSAGMIIQPSGPYGPSELTPGEQSQLKSYSEIEHLLPPPLTLRAAPVRR
jgi:hypothetical protein